MMNAKILKTLEFGRIIHRLAEQAITVPAKKLAQNLVPSGNFEQVKLSLAQTLVLVNLLRVKGLLPLTNFQDVHPSLQRLRIKANLNAKELGNFLLILTLAQEVQHFLGEVDQKEVDLTAIEAIVNHLQLPIVFFKDLKKSVKPDGEVLSTASKNLTHLRQRLQQNETRIKNQMNAYVKGKMAKYLSEAVVTIRDDRYVLPVKQENRRRFGGIVHDQSATGQTLFIEPAAVMPFNNEQQNLIAQERQEVQRILQHLSTLARTQIPTLKQIAASLTKLDFLQAKAKLARQMQATEPNLNKRHEINLLRARHPLIDPKKVVPNDIRLGQKFDMMLLTGPNTGGKTITLKTVGLLQLMAQAGLFIPANEGSLVGVFQEIDADIGDEQSIEQSLSTFSSHIDDIITIMKYVDQNTLVLIDEIGAGTDPEEGSSLAIGILDFLRKKKAKVMVTTHYPALKLYGYNRPRTVNASMEFDLKTLAPTYHLQIGIPGHSNAFAIARRLGMREDVVQQAQGLMSKNNSEINQMISKLNEQTKKATSARNRLETALDRGHKLVTKLQAALDWYQQRVQKQLAFVQEQSNEIIAKRRKKANRIIAALEREGHNAASVKENKLIEAKGEMNSLQREASNLAHNKVLQREKKRHQVKVGDQVKVLSYGQTGTITKKLAAHQYEVQLGIVKVKVSDRDVARVDQKNKKEQSHLVRATSVITNNRNVHPELDLRGQRYQEAMTNLDRYLDAALLAGLANVTIIHGIGTGAIRKGVQKYLRGNNHVEAFHYAPANQGGDGATIVQLK